MANPNTKFPEGLSDYLDDELRRLGERWAGPPKVPRMKTGLNFLKRSNQMKITTHMLGKDHHSQQIAMLK